MCALYPVFHTVFFTQSLCVHSHKPHWIKSIITLCLILPFLLHLTASFSHISTPNLLSTTSAVDHSLLLLPTLPLIFFFFPPHLSLPLTCLSKAINSSETLFRPLSRLHCLVLSHTCIHTRSCSTFMLASAHTTTTSSSFATTMHTSTK